jgi:hypothetical protein
MSFDVSRIRQADRIIGVSAVLFFVFLFFFKWYGVSTNVSSLGGLNLNYTKSGWSVFTNSRWIWLITIIVALIAVARASGALNFQSPVQMSVLVTGLGALSTITILYRIIHHPTASASFGTYHASVGIKLGIWLGLIAALAITYGGYLAMQNEGTSISDVREQASGALSNLSAQAGAGQPSAPPPSEPSATEPLAPPIPPPPADPGPQPPGSPQQ